jgi:hypothetical protein
MGKREREGDMRAITTAAILVLALALVGGAGSRPGGGGGSDDCELDGQIFAYWGGADVEAAGFVRCATVKSWISVSAVVTRDGAFVASGGHTCRKASSCRITFAPLDDPDGDQLWCIEVSGEVQRGTALGPRTFCESFDAI